MTADILDKAKAALERCDVDGRFGVVCSGADPSTDSGWIPACAGMTEMRGNDRDA